MSSSPAFSFVRNPAFAADLFCCSPDSPRDRSVSQALAGCCSAWLLLFLAALAAPLRGRDCLPVTLGNLLGGFVLFALFWRMATLPPEPVQRRQSSPWHWLAALGLMVQIALGALVSGSHAALSCPSLTDCQVMTHRFRGRA